MRVEAKHRKTGQVIKGTLVQAKEALANPTNRGLHSRELVILLEAFHVCYELREMVYILKEEE